MDAAPRRAVSDCPADRADQPGEGADRPGDCADQPGEGAVIMAGVPDEPLAVVVVGSAGAGRGPVLGALLGVPAVTLRVPRGSYLVIGLGEAGEGEAYVPGYRRPYPYRPEPVGAGPALARPPRRVELALPAPLLRHFNCVTTPDPGTLGVAGRRVVRDVVERGGALLFVLAAEAAPTPAELELLAEIAAGEAAVFFVVTRSRSHVGAGGAVVPAAVTPAAVAAVDRADVRAGDRADATAGAHADGTPHRAAVLAAVPALEDAPWFVVDPAAPDVTALSQALTGWATLEELRRASLAPPVVPEQVTGGVTVAPGAATSDWEELLDARIRQRGQRVRQSLALELANIHLRCVEAIVFGSGCPGLPDHLDQELHALSIEAVRDCAEGVQDVLAEAARQVFEPTADRAGGNGREPGGLDRQGGGAGQDVRRWLAVAVGWGLAEYRHGRDLDRVLLVGSDGTVHPVTGLGAVRALAAYPTECPTTVLPPLGIALAGGCYQYWRNPMNADVSSARSWLQRVLREVELELSREVLRRFAAVQAALVPVLRTAVAEGVLRLASTAKGAAGDRPA